MRLLQPLSLALLLFCLAAPVKAEMYKWVDENGVTHYGDRVPPKYAKQQREVLNTQGDTVEILEHEKTAAEIAEDEREATLERQEEEQAKRDRILLDMYISEQDMMNARDQQLASVDGSIRIREISMQSTEKDLKSRQARAADLAKQGKPVPPDLERQINSLETQMANHQKALAARQQERQAVVERFERDLKRYRELRGISSSTAKADSAADQGADASVGK